MQNIFEPDHNCWRVAHADCVSVVVDYGNYYRDLRESILKARRSIFVLGWDIDSRIELLRGDDAGGEDAVTLFDLIVKVARANPDLKIYLNKWDYSVFFMQQREPFWMHKWRSAKLSNVFFCLDDRLPMGACHHQKVVVIDDEVAYWGGMDVALGRWDFRHHHIHNDDRADPSQVFELQEKTHFGPYHDIQAVLSGPAARELAELVRVRWRIACPHVEPIPIADAHNHAVQTWPDTDPPDFYGIDVAIARTLPKMKPHTHTEEVIHSLVAQISVAEEFIYIENQFLTSIEIAEALNKRLREAPDLRVLLVSCWRPQGIMERRAMWGGRLRFRRRLEKHGMGHRVAMAHPICSEKGRIAPVRIHSKLMIVDDKFLHIGSSNLNNRSMGMDTECDITLIANKPAHKEKVIAVRNDLIREHTGFSVERIDEIISQRQRVSLFLQEKSGSRQHLWAIDDSIYARDRFVDLAIQIGDPRRPPIGAHLTRFPDKFRIRGLHTGRRIWLALAVLTLLAFFLLPVAWSASGLKDIVDPQYIMSLIEWIKDSPWAPVWIIGAFILGGLVFFPLTVMSTAVILAFGGITGLVYAMVGSLASGALGYVIGRALGRDRVERIFPSTKKSIKKVRMTGVIGVTALRTLPIAPYTLVNLLMGVINMPLGVFLAGTFLGLLPGKVMLSLFGTSLKEAFANPNPVTIAQTALFLAVWAGVIVGCHRFATRWQAKHGHADADDDSKQHTPQDGFDDVTGAKRKNSA